MDDKDDQGQLFDTTPPPQPGRFIEPNLTVNERRQYKKMTRIQDNVTSIIAAKKALPKVKGHKKIVLDAFVERGNYGYTHEELGEQVPIRADTARKRTKDLVDAGYIEDSGVKRRVSSGNMSIVWRATFKAYREKQSDV
jgi:hypothetical protein